MTNSPTPGVPVPLDDPDHRDAEIADEVRAAVERVLAGSSSDRGVEVAEFECEFARFCDAREAVACRSATDAVALALAALEIGPGDEVLVPALGPVTAAVAIRRVGATPVLVDIEPTSLHLDPARIVAAITPRTTAVIPAHLFGQCVEMEPIWRTAVAHGLHVIEEATGAIGASYHGRRTGVLGTLGCFGTRGAHEDGTLGIAGGVTTDDRHLARRLRRLRVEGVDDDGSEIGFDSRLDDLGAAIPRVHLRHTERWVRQRQENAVRYERLLVEHGLNGVVIPTARGTDEHAFDSYVVRVPADIRDALAASLRSAGIGCAVPFPIPLHQVPALAARRSGDLRETTRATRETLLLPMHPGLDAASQDRVIGTIAATLGLNVTRRAA